MAKALNERGVNFFSEVDDMPCIMWLHVSSRRRWLHFQVPFIAMLVIRRHKLLLFLEGLRKHSLVGHGRALNIAP